LDPRRSTLTLEGEVSLRRGALSLEAPRVEVTLDASGAVARAALAGPVTARTATAVLRAPGATVDVGAGVVTLPGPVQLHQAGVALTAGGVTLALNTGALDLTDVRGTLRLGPR
jgi:lipopolysaccharide export system protein LptA